MKKLIPVLVVFVLIIIVGFAWVTSVIKERNTPTDVKMDSALYYEIEQLGETRSELTVPLMINGELKKTQGRLIDDTVYIDYDIVIDSINKRFYWDKNEGYLLYALPTEVIEIKLEGGSADYQMVGQQLYVSIDMIQAYTEMDCQILTDPVRVVIRNDWDSVRVVQAVENTQVRYRGGIKSEVLTEVAAGEELQVLDAESFENWTQVASSDGYIGYIDNRYIGEVHDKENAPVYEEPEYPSLKRDHKINMVWHQVTNAAANNTAEGMLKHVTGVNVIAPTWFFFNDMNGGLVNLASSDYVAMAHERGMEVWAVLNDFDGSVSSADSTYAVLSKTSARKQIISEVVTTVLECGADGINVDIEKVSESCAPHYLQFLRELSVQCRVNSLVLSIDNYVPTYSTYYDREEQGKIADYIVIMGYDEHFAGSEKAGSVASVSFVEDGIKRTLEEVPAEKLINGIPFYTRIWKTTGDGSVTSEACGMAAAESYLTDNGMNRAWDQECGQNYAQLQTEDALFEVWLEDARSVEEKMKVIQKYDLAGVAAWKLGFETDNIWEIISNYLQ